MPMHLPMVVGHGCSSTRWSSSSSRSSLRSRARQGMSTRGLSYGYLTVGGKRVIGPWQAEVVRRIFTLHAEGHSRRTVAAGLDEEGIPSPGSTWSRSTRQRREWPAFAIGGYPKRGVGVLNNEPYRGVVIWNRFRRVRPAQNGTRTRFAVTPLQKGGRPKAAEDAAPRRARRPHRRTGHPGRRLHGRAGALIPRGAGVKEAPETALLSFMRMRRKSCSARLRGLV